MAMAPPDFNFDNRLERFRRAVVTLPTAIDETRILRALYAAPWASELPRNVHVVRKDKLLRAVLGGARIFDNFEISWTGKGSRSHDPEITDRRLSHDYGNLSSLRFLSGAGLDSLAWAYWNRMETRSGRDIRDERESLHVAKVFALPIHAAYECHGRLIPGDRGTHLALFEAGVLALCIAPNYLFCVPRPTLVKIDTIMDDSNPWNGPRRARRLHSINTPSVEWLDDITYYHIHGVPAPRIAIEDPARLSLAMISDAANVEVRRTLIGIYGLERYVVDIGAEVVSKDTYGELLLVRQTGDEDIMMVKVLNSTPELDGSVRIYFLRVPPSVRTPQEGIAWTFGLKGTAYAPAKMT